MGSEMCIRDRHRGVIALVPHQGPGTTIRMTLPIAQGRGGLTEG